MRYTTHELWKLVGKVPAVTLQSIADRVWTDLISVLLSSAVGIEENKQALVHLNEILDLHKDSQEEERKAALIKASHWLASLS